MSQLPPAGQLPPPTGPRFAPRTKWYRRPAVWLTAAGAVVMVPAVVISETNGDTDDNDAAMGDALAKRACSEFVIMVDEVDLMTDTEIRERMQGVYGDASASATPAVGEAARAVLAAMTDPEHAGHERAIEHMALVCSNVRY